MLDNMAPEVNPVEGIPGSPREDVLPGAEGSMKKGLIRFLWLSVIDK